MLEALPSSRSSYLQHSIMTTDDPGLLKYFGFFEDLLRTRQPTFLSRNIRAALDYHEQWLEGKPSGESAEPAAFERHWQYFPKDMNLEHLIDNMDDGKFFNVSISGLWPIGTTTNNSSKKNGAANGTLPGELDPTARAKIWEDLGNSTTIFQHSCNISMHITYTGPNKGFPLANSEREMFKALENAMVKGKEDKRGRRFVKIEAEPFKVDVQGLLVPTTSGAQPGWTRAIGKLYEVRIHLSHRNTQKTERLLSHLGLESSEKDMESLIGTWKDLHCLPCAGQTIPLFLKTGERNVSIPEYTFDLNMWYSKVGGNSPLAFYQASKQHQTKALPSPSLDSRLVKQKIELDYRVPKGFTDITTRHDELKCAFSENCRQIFFNTDRLRLHLKKSHGMYDFKFEQKYEQRGDLTINKIVIEILGQSKAETVRASDSVPDVFSVNWAPPREPFDIAEHLAGNNEWVQKGNHDGKKKSASKVSAANSVIRPKSPSKVGKLSVPNRKKYKVPRAPPGITFYRTVTKRALVEGEYVSESDDDIDMSWIKQRRTGETSDPNMPEEAKAFIKVFDDYLEDERLTADLHLGDALVRFADKHSGWLKQRWAAKEFLKKSGELRDDGIISEAVFQHFEELLRETATDQNGEKSQSNGIGVHSTAPQTQTINGSIDGTAIQAESSNQRTSNSRARRASHVRDENGDIDMTDSSPSNSRHINGKANGNRDRPPDTCICGGWAEEASRIRDCIYCDNKVSSLHYVMPFLLL